VNITLDIKCPELAQAINNLAAAMSIRSVDGALQDIVKPAVKALMKATPEEAQVKAILKGKPPVGEAVPSELAEPEPATVPEQEPAAAAETATGVDYTQVKAAVLKVSQEKGRAAAVELLGEFDAKVGGDLTEEQWGPFLARAAEVLG
jgi:hypothetical protein